MEHHESPVEQTVTISHCPTCGFELAGERAICACDTSTLVPAVDPMLGRTLGPNKLVEEIGRGGMGIIYKAHDQWMDRIVAIKMLHPHLVHDQQSLQRFHQEAKAAGNIEHPNVISAYDFGVASDTKQPYLVLEYLQGKSLADVIESEGQIEPERAVRIFIQACDALAAAHAKNVLHRDLKPSNIMLVQMKDEPDFVKIVDFGIAKLLPGSGKEMQLTQTGEVFGSPLYMSPEQFVGRKLDARTDIYAMGVVMYEALIGKPPIMGENVLETMFKHMNEVPKKFSEARPGLKIPPKIEAIVMRALEKDPDQRFQTMSELRDALLLTKAGFKDRRPLKVRLQARLSQLKRFRKRHDELASNIALFILSVIILGCIGGFAVMFMKNNQESEWRTLKADAQKAYAREDYDQAKRKFALAAKKAKDNFGDEDPRYIDTLKRLAWVCDAKGDYSLGREVFEKVYKLSPDEYYKIRISQTVNAGQKLADILMNQGASQLVELGCRKASEGLEKYLGSNDPGLIPILERLAMIYQQENKLEDAETQYLRIFSIMRETEGDESKGAAYAHRLLGDLYTVWHKKDEAAQNYNEAIRIYKVLLGDEAAPYVKEVEDRMNGKVPAGAQAPKKDDVPSLDDAFKPAAE